MNTTLKVRNREAEMEEFIRRETELETLRERDAHAREESWGQEDDREGGAT